MFKSEGMQRIRVYSDKSKLNSLVSALYDFGAIHVTQAKHGYLKEYGQTLDVFKDIRRDFKRVKRIGKTIHKTNFRHGNPTKAAN